MNNQQIRGSTHKPVHDITIQGLIFSHTRNTYMEPYEVPSGGDWALHRYEYMNEY